MKKFVKTVCFLLTLIALSTLVLAPATAHASRPTEVSGTYTVGPIIILDVRQADGNLIMKQVEYGVLYGVVAGPYTFERTVIVHSNGEATVHGTMTVAPATVLDRSGTFTMQVNAKVSAGIIQGRWVTLSGTVELANYHGQGTFAGTAGVAGTYAGQIHFDPN